MLGSTHSATKTLVQSAHTTRNRSARNHSLVAKAMVGQERPHRDQVPVAVVPAHFIIYIHSPPVASPSSSCPSIAVPARARVRHPASAYPRHVPWSWGRATSPAAYAHAVNTERRRWTCFFVCGSSVNFNTYVHGNTPISD